MSRCQSVAFPETSCQDAKKQWVGMRFLAVNLWPSTETAMEKASKGCCEASSGQPVALLLPALKESATRRLKWKELL